LGLFIFFQSILLLIEFNGTKFYPDQIEYDDYHSTKPLPRVEGDTLIISNPAWSM